MSRYIITTGGGLGNQMMNYCLWYYLTFIERKQAILYPTKDVGFSKIFSNTINVDSTKWYIDIYLIISIRIIAPICRGCIKFLHLKSRNVLLYFPIKIIEFLGWENYHFIGEISNLKEIFRFPQLDDRNLDIVNLMNNSESVSIHVRRGDYQNNLFWRIRLGDICDEEYYLRAISKVKSIFANPKFFIFSDDIEWVKSKLKLKNALYIDWNTGRDSYRDMQLISHCKCNICANSTFSLMSSWLNSNLNPIRIVPTKWMNQFEDSLFSRYIPDEKWIAINNDRPTVSIVVYCSVTIKDMKNILCQSYSDFEILVKEDWNSFYMDERIKNDETPEGRFVLEVHDCNFFKDKHSLWKWVEGQLYCLMKLENSEVVI